MSYKISDQDIQSSKQLSKRIIQQISEELQNNQTVVQNCKKVFEYLTELERYFSRQSGSTAQELYQNIRQARKEIEQCFSVTVKQDTLKNFYNIFSNEDFVLVNLTATEKLTEQFNTLTEGKLVDRPREVGSAYKYPTIPLTYRDELKKQGFVQGRTVANWLKDYKGYTIMVHEGTNRKRLEVQVKRGGTPFRGYKIGGDLLSGTKIVYTEEELLKIIKEFEEKIDKMRKDPSDRVTVNVDDSFDWNFMTEGMNSLEDRMNADVVKIIDYTKAHLDAFLRHDEGIEEWLNNMSEEGKLDIPAEYCDDYENVRDDEAFEYFKDLLTKTDLAAELDILRDTGDISNYQKIKRAFPKTNNSITSHADAISSGKQQMFNLVSSLRSDNGLSNRDILDIVQSVLGEGN